MTNCWQNKVKTVTLPCKFGTEFFLHLDRVPPYSLAGLDSSGLYALGPGMIPSTKNKQQTHKQANQTVHNFAKDSAKLYQKYHIFMNSDSFQFKTNAS